MTAVRPSGLCHVRWRGYPPALDQGRSIEANRLLHARRLLDNRWNRVADG
ncbi:MAG: hypothetical protein ACTHMB_02755 [Candidatus Binatia bacterium]